MLKRWAGIRLGTLALTLTQVLTPSAPNISVAGLQLYDLTVVMTEPGPSRDRKGM